MRTNPPSSSRRQFLGATLATAATSSLFANPLLLNADEADKNPAASQEKADKPFKKAVKIGMVKVKGSLTDKFKALKELGFDGVELGAPGGPAADQVEEAKQATGLTVHGVVDGVHWRDTLSHSSAEVRGRGLNALKEAIKASKSYGGTSVLLVPGVVNDDATYEQCWERSIPEIKKAIPLAEDLGIHILIENVWNNFLTKPKQMADYLDELDSNLVGAYYDVGNSVRYAPPVEWIKTLGKRIVKLDIKEYHLDKGKSEGWYAGFRVKLLDGSCNWPLVMKTLKEIGFSGWGTAEIPGGDRERLAEIADRMDRIYAS